MADECNCNVILLVDVVPVVNVINAAMLDGLVGRGGGAAGAAGVGAGGGVDEDEGEGEGEEESGSRLTAATSPPSESDLNQFAHSLVPPRPVSTELLISTSASIQNLLQLGQLSFDIIFLYVFR